MIRYAFINNLVLQIYQSMPEIVFPIDPKWVINLIPNCRYMSYQQFAEINHCSIDDVIQVCESKSGCTHYDMKHNRYLIMCNQSTVDNNNPGRQRWTCGHEIGHILCKHHKISANAKLAENSLLPQTNNPEYEAEADYFAAMLLAPFPLFQEFGIQSANHVQLVFGLSAEASTYRFEQYKRWKHDHRKTSWENDMIRLYRSQYIEM